MIASTIYSGMSVVLLWITVQICGMKVGGIFSITFSSSQMLQSIGYFGVRNYQVSDTKQEFPFSVYLSSRAISMFGMMLACVLYQWVMGYTEEKLVVYYAFCMVKLIEAAADVFEGLLQQKDKLDISAKAWLTRSLLALIGFTGVLLTTQNLMLAAWAMLVGTLIGVVLFFVFQIKRFVDINISLDFSAIKSLIVQCLPLFLSSAFLLYLNNSPKIAIDNYLGYEAQTNFNIIFMPTFVINLLCGFMFRPLLGRMAQLYISCKHENFLSLNRRLFTGTALISLVVLTSGFFLGIPILSWIYGIQLTAFRKPLMLVLLGGSFCALVNLLNIILTVIRRQEIMVIAYGTLTVMTFFWTPPLVTRFELTGAAFSYLLTMMTLVIILGVFYISHRHVEP